MRLRPIHDAHATMNPVEPRSQASPDTGRRGSDHNARSHSFGVTAKPVYGTSLEYPSVDDGGGRVGLVAGTRRRC